MDNQPTIGRERKGFPLPSPDRQGGVIRKNSSSNATLVTIKSKSYVVKNKMEIL